MTPSQTLLLLVFFSCLSYSLGFEEGCDCLKLFITGPGMICKGNFSGVVQVTGPEESCPEKRNCFEIQVLESFRKDIETDSITRMERQDCRGTRIPSPGTIIVSGVIENGNTLFLPTCQYERVLKQVNGLEDPEVDKYRQHASIYCQ